MTTVSNTKTDQAPQFEVGTTVHVAPTTLLMTKNIREAKPSAALIKSVDDLGVLQPIVAVTTTTGEALMVRFGHRRTLAAVEANTTTVPVYIAGIDGDTKTDEVLRVIAQRDENTHRDGLTAADDLHVVETLISHGLTAAQVAKQARIKRTDVDAAVAVSESNLARKASERYEALTLDQLATVADFEDDADTVKALIAAASTGQFDHVAQRARDDREAVRARETLIAQLTNAGLRVIDRPSYDSKTKAVNSLKSDAKASERLSPETHAQCPGRVVWIAPEWVRVDKTGQIVESPAEPDGDAGEAAWEAHEAACDRFQATTRQAQRPGPVYGCEAPTKYGHVDPYASGSNRKSAAQQDETEREAAKKARALVVENNKQWVAAETVRREWLAAFAARKTAPKGTSAFLATALSRDNSAVSSSSGNALAAEWLNTKHTGYGWANLSPAKNATEQRALMIALVQILGGYEAEQTKDSWRRDGTNNATGRYLRFLETCGYALSDVEKYATSKQTA